MNATVVKATRTDQAWMEYQIRLHAAYECAISLDSSTRSLSPVALCDWLRAYQGDEWPACRRIASDLSWHRALWLDLEGPISKEDLRRLDRDCCRREEVGA